MRKILSTVALMAFAIQQSSAVTTATFTGTSLQVVIFASAGSAVVTVDSGFVKVNGADPMVSGVPTPVATSAVSFIDLSINPGGTNSVDLSAVTTANGFPTPSQLYSIRTGLGNDTVIGSGFGDSILLSTGTDSINGGEGTDWYFITGDTGTTVIDEPADTTQDFVSFVLGPSATPRNFNVTGASGFVRFTSLAPSPASTIDIKGVQNLWYDGSPFNDTVTIQGPLSPAAPVSFSLAGQGGDDTFTLTGTQDYDALGNVITGAAGLAGNDTYTFLDKSRSTIDFLGTSGADTISATDGAVCTMSIAGTATGTASFNPVKSVLIRCGLGADNVTFPPLTTMSIDSLRVEPAAGDDLVDLRGIGNTIPYVEVTAHEGFGTDSYFADTDNAIIKYYNYCLTTAGTEPPTYAIGADGTRMSFTRAGGSWGFSSTGFRDFEILGYNYGSTQRATYNFATLPADAPTGSIKFNASFTSNSVTVNTPMGNRSLIMGGHPGLHDILNVDVLGAVWTLGPSTLTASPSMAMSHNNWDEINIVNGPPASVGDWTEF